MESDSRRGIKVPVGVIAIDPHGLFLLLANSTGGFSPRAFNHCGGLFSILEYPQGTVDKYWEWVLVSKLAFSHNMKGG